VIDREDLLRATYEAFNARDIDTVLRQMAPDVDWPNAWEGGRVVGHDAVRDYWTRQWAEIDPEVQPQAFRRLPDGRIEVTVHQVVRSRDGSVVSDGVVLHIYEFRGERVARMDVVAGAGDRKQTVRRFVDEAVNGGRDEVIEELFTHDAAVRAREWFGAFRGSFPDMRMELLELIAEGDRVVGRFACSATHLGDWRGHPPTGRRFERIDEVYFFTFAGDRIAEVWGIEDTLDRFRQLGLDPAGG
jgi:predicted ester cyclase